MTDAAPAARDPYTCCPDCGFITPPGSMDYAVAPGGSVDWDSPVRVTCPCCHADHRIGPDDVLTADAEMPCKRCGHRVAHPAGAARVRCPACGLFLLGPDLTAAQLGELRITEGMTGLAARAAVQAAKDRRAARRAAGTPGPDGGAQ